MSDRELLEQAALQAVEATDYYDLCDYLEVTTDDELLAIIENGTR